jgi:hypothetical protein
MKEWEQNSRPGIKATPSQKKNQKRKKNKTKTKNKKQQNTNIVLCVYGFLKRN